MSELVARKSGNQKTRKDDTRVRIIDLVVSEIMRIFATVNEIEDGGPLSFLYGL